MCKVFSRALLLGLLLLAIKPANAAELYWNDGNMIHRAALDGSGRSERGGDVLHARHCR